MTAPKRICTKCGGIMFNRNNNAKYCKLCATKEENEYHKRYYRNRKKVKASGR